MLSFNKIVNNQKGFSLIELMIGLVISLSIITGAVGYLLSSSRSLSNQNSTDLIQENARFAFDILSSNIRLAGMNNTAYTDLYNSDRFSYVQGITTQAICSPNPNTEPAASHTTACTADGFNYTLGGNTYDSDRIAFDYVTSSGFTCAGTEITSEVSVIQVYWVGDIDGDGIPSLYCQAYTSTIGVSKNYDNYTLVNGAATPLVDGVDSMQIQYGVDTDADGSIDRYSSFSNLTAATMSSIHSIKVGILVNNGQVVSFQANEETPQARNYRVLDSVYTSLETDGVFRQALSTTIFFPNLPVVAF